MNSKKNSSIAGGLWRFVTQKPVCPNPQNLDYEGKNIIITGANTGVGFKTAKMMAQTKGSIYMVCRNKEKAEKAMKKIIKEVPKASLKFMHIDLSSLHSVKKFCDKVDFNVDILINNAGGNWSYHPKHISIDGYELNVTVNALCTYYLTKKLLPKIKKKTGRVVYVSAIAHLLVSENFYRQQKVNDFLTYSLKFPTFTVSKMIYQFAISKLLGNMIMFNMHNEYYEKTGISFNAIHPHNGGNTMYVATKENIGSGKYIENGKSYNGNVFQYDEKLQNKVREVFDKIINDFEKKM